MYPVFPKSLFSIADLFAVRYLWVVCNEDKCCVVTQRAADIYAGWRRANKKERVNCCLPLSCCCLVTRS